MKRFAIIVVMALMSLTASANSIRYFTYGQAQRTVSYLNAQNEMVIYCGYDYEIETYVLINEVWMERVNSSYYEIWVFGYDAYTGDEIYMPLDLKCVWLYSAGRMYSAAQYLRFHATVSTPRFTWYVPTYKPFTRVMHRSGYTRSYHYDVHRHGWMPPTPPRGGYGPHTQPPLPPYYMRTPQSPTPTPTAVWTPGVEHPQVSTSGRRGESDLSTPRNTTGSQQPTTRPATSGDRSSGTATTPRSGSSTTSGRSGESATTGTRSGNDNGGRSGSGTTTSGRSGESATTGTRNGNDNGGRSGSGTTTSGRSGESATTGTRSGSTTTTGSRGSESTTTGTRGTGNKPTRANTGTSTNESATADDKPATSGRGGKTTTTSGRGGKTTTTGTTTSGRGTTTGGRGTTTGGRGNK